TGAGSRQRGGFAESRSRPERRREGPGGSPGGRTTALQSGYRRLLARLRRDAGPRREVRGGAEDHAVWNRRDAAGSLRQQDLFESRPFLTSSGHPGLRLHSPALWLAPQCSAIPSECLFQLDEICARIKEHSFKSNRPTADAGWSERRVSEL